MKLLDTKIATRDLVTAALIAFVILGLGVVWITWARSGPFIAKIMMSQTHSMLPYSHGLNEEMLEDSELSKAMTVSGQWGDGFGPLNTLFAGFAFGGTLVALYIQGRTLVEQKADLHRQRFESTFFELLSLLRTAREEVRFRHSQPYRRAVGMKPQSLYYKVLTGPTAFRRAIAEMHHWLAAASVTDREDRDFVATLYRRRVHMRFESTFGAYFRLLYTLLKFIDNDRTLTEAEKIKYGNMVRGQLTSFEVGLSGFNALMKEANDFSGLVAEFRLLKYYPETAIREVLEGLYTRETFLGRDDQPAQPGDMLLGFIFGSLFGLAFGLLFVLAFDRYVGYPILIVSGLGGACLGSILANRGTENKPSRWPFRKPATEGPYR
ncbi:putative phage abortive infection protein [Rhizobium ruizarguesonis]|uniref:putative phage abortive infection protein n=1 Tax=Rhizobium TaxID=379 RepID=UPI001031228C|nr:putative phage abortive infection protein [Rhizobium ruizarguesonis]TBA37492.1 hypothetical protein ELH60_08580 [Rhizobium ruizarguesonis]TBC62838.1 hypothetical protein ELH36_08585 [Rhizobium ruizarguesonis]TBD37481.1 hypothetical protein ELH18_08410 [Rhizobium ruizarguesonis]